MGGTLLATPGELAHERFVEPLGEARDESWRALQDAEAADAELTSTAGNSFEGVREPTEGQKEA